MDDEQATLSQRPVQLRLDKPGYVFGSLGNLVVAITLQPPSRESVRELARVVEALREANPDGLAILVAPRARRPALSADARRAIASSWEQFEKHMLCWVVLFRESGFISAIQRSLVTTIINMRRSPIPTKVSSNPFDAADFIVRHNSHFASAAPLGNAVGAFIKQYEP